MSDEDIRNNCRRTYAAAICHQGDWTRDVEAYLGRDGALPSDSHRLEEEEAWTNVPGSDLPVASKC